MNISHLPIKDFSIFSSDGEIRINIINPITSQISIVAESYKAYNKYGDIITKFPKQKKIVLEIEATDLELIKLSADPAENGPDIRNQEQNDSGYFFDQNTILDNNDISIDLLSDFDIDCAEYNFLQEIENDG